MTLSQLPGRAGRLSIELNLGGDPDPMYVTCGIGAFDPSTPSQADVAALTGLWRANLEPLMTAAYAVVGSKFLWNDAGATGLPTHSFEVSGLAGVGNVLGEAVPQNVACLVKKTTNDFGRGSSGRFYVPGISIDEVTSQGNLSVAYVANAQDSMDALFDAMPLEPMQWAPVVLHYGPRVSEPPDTDPLDYPVQPFGIVTAFAVQTLCATQRRRLR